MQLSGRRQFSWKRRLTTGAIVLIVAAALSIWISKRERQRYDDIRQCINCLCASLVGSSAAAPQPCGACDGDAVSLRKIKDIVSAIPDGQLSLISIDVAPKGLSPFDRKVGSHEAILLVGGRPRLGLFIDATTNEQIYITGYWDPQAP